MQQADDQLAFSRRLFLGRNHETLPGSNGLLGADPIGATKLGEGDTVPLRDPEQGLILAHHVHALGRSLGL